jgi:hypothetical protein
MSSTTSWYAEAPAGSPDTYITTRKVTYAWANPPKWIYDIISKKDFSDIHGSIYAAPHASVPTLICCIAAGFYFDISVIGGNKQTLPGALPHDRMYAAAALIARFYGIPRRTVLHIADHWFLATLRMSSWTFKRSYFIAVRTFGYAFNSMFSKGAK